ncbi:MFS general substrate transporter [Morchella conica CCBAS932]|uniref:MFS general substrate transporter n=1 Tax=Morchella conica CCBAS932 TaxID=1392247 RepID=A0A3N4L1J7_9PEZI|nr:MFS general substrate transporter [Morchella conica CCBAS932]
MAAQPAAPTAAARSPAYAKSILKVLFISLLFDLLSFTLILPLFPRLLDFYKAQPNNVVLESIFNTLNAFKASFHRPISSRFDVVLLGGALGSLFSFLQAVSSPIIGSLSDRYGRRTALLYSMIGNILSVLLWVAATDFPTFLASRVVGGLSEGNVQLAIAIATDVSTAETRGATLALVGVAFSIAFTFGPMMGAYLASKTLALTISEKNPFVTAALFSLGLLVVETAFLYWKLPETRPLRDAAEKEEEKKKKMTVAEEKTTAEKARSDAAGITLLNATHLLFLLIFSGMEFSLPFMTFDLFNYTSTDSGKLLGFIGLLASVLQGSFVRRAKPALVVKTGLTSAAISFFLLSRVNSQRELYVAAAFLAVTSACVVTGLTALVSLKIGEQERGRVLGGFRSAGQIGRATGPLLFCTLYWWAGRETAYVVGGTGMVGVATLVWRGLGK